MESLRKWKQEDKDIILTKSELCEGMPIYPYSHLGARAVDKAQ